jgi:hypothetical protein
MRKRRFVIRTIRNGQVKINGQIFKPADRWLEYDGRLDGIRYAFGLYWSGGAILPFVSLRGTEAAFHATSAEEIGQHWPGPECVNGFFHWAWWYTDEFREKLATGTGTR